MAVTEQDIIRAVEALVPDIDIHGGCIFLGVNHER